MAFSFNPGQTATAGTPMSGGGITAPGAGEVQAVALAVPDSPFLFMQQRGQEMTVGAYVQIILAMLSILAVLVSLTLFGYGMYLSSSIESKKEELLAQDAAFKDLPLDEMKRLSKKMEVLNGLLKNYISARIPLKMLEDVVEKQVVFDKFSFKKNYKDIDYTMSFTVITTNYQALIQQLEALNLAQYSKIVPKTKVGLLVDGTAKLSVEITAPVKAQGTLPEDVNFVSMGKSLVVSSHQVQGTTTATSSTP